MTLHVLEFEKRHVWNVLRTSSKLNFSKDWEIGLNISWTRKLKFREVKLLLKSTEVMSDWDEIWCFIFLLQTMFLSCYILVITAVIISKCDVVLNKKWNKIHLSIESLIIIELWKKKDGMKLMVLDNHLSSFSNLWICHLIFNACSSESDEKILVLLKWLSTLSPLCTVFEDTCT